MDDDATVCYCFRVSRRKLTNYLRRHLPSAASRLSECGGAGTGCGWCVPFLIELFAAEAAGSPARRLDSLTPEEYERLRGRHLGRESQESNEET